MCSLLSVLCVCLFFKIWFNLHLFICRSNNLSLSLSLCVLFCLYCVSASFLKFGLTSICLFVDLSIYNSHCVFVCRSILVSVSLTLSVFFLSVWVCTSHICFFSFSLTSKSKNINKFNTNPKSVTFWVASAAAKSICYRESERKISVQCHVRLFFI